MSDVTVTTLQRALLFEIARFEAPPTYAALGEALGCERKARYAVRPLCELGLITTVRRTDSKGSRVTLELTDAGRAALAAPPSESSGWGVSVARLNVDPEAVEHALRWEADIDTLLARRQILEQLPYEEDDLTQLFVAEHPGGATLDEIGDLLGVSRERVRQIVEAALGRLARRGYLAGLHQYLEAA